jgi:hypothetical protein
MFPVSQNIDDTSKNNSAYMLHVLLLDYMSDVSSRFPIENTANSICFLALDIRKRSS